MSESYVGRVNLDISVPTGAGSVNNPRPEYSWMQGYWRTIDLVADGFESAKNSAGSIIPQLYAEQDESYQTRLKHLDFLPLFSRLIDLTAAMICRKAITVTVREGAPVAVSEILEEHLEDIDSQGRSLDSFIRDFLKTQITYSIAGILIDAPSKAAGEKISLADEKKYNLRPYWVAIKPKDLISWRHERVGAANQLVHLRVRSTREQVVGEFGVKVVPIIRVYDLVEGVVVCRTFVQSDKDWVEDPELRTQIGLPYIPYFSMNTNPQGLFTARPEMYELAILNIGHTRTSSDLAFALNLAAHPKLKRLRTVQFAEDYTNENTIDMAPDKVLTPGVGEDYEWLSAPDSAFSALERKIEKYEEDSKKMFTMMILGQTNGVESAQSKRLNQNQGNSSLLKIVIELDSLLENCIQAHCDLMDVTTIGSESAICLNVNRDLAAEEMSVELLREYSELEIKGQISKRSLLEAMMRGQLWWEDFDVERELIQVDKLSASDDR
jgi:hypothetical protein